jgi:molybdate transport system ATP-binding protein
VKTPQPAPVLSFRLVRRQKDFTLDASGDAGAGITALFGRSGSGKTTTLECIAGLRRPDEGEVTLNGRVLFSSSGRVNLPPEKRGVGYVFQDGALFPHMTALGNIRYGAGRRPVERAQRAVDVDEVVKLLRLGPLLDRRPAQLSAGERQRVALARALAASPEVLLLDEPMASLDAALRGVVTGYLKRVRRELGVPMLYVSHSITEVLALADSVLLIEGGRVVAFDRPSRVLLQSHAGFWQEAGALDNLLDGVVEDAAPQSGAGKVRVGDVMLFAPVGTRQKGEKVTISIGAAELIVAVEPPRGLSARNIVPARLVKLEQEQGRVFATLDIGAPLIAELTAPAVEDLRLAPGQRVHLVFKSSSIAVLDAESG